MVAKSSTIGILALQGAVREHQRAIERCGARVLPIKQPDELALIDGLIIPGGESTTIGKLMAEYGFLEPIRERAADGLAVFGTCAGLILLAKETVEPSEHLLGLMDIKARRNAFGRQVDSFEADLSIDIFAPPAVRATFIRAPWIERSGPGVQVLAVHNGHAVLAREGRLLAGAFHPELTDDLRLHRYFIEEVMKGDSDVRPLKMVNDKA